MKDNLFIEYSEGKKKKSFEVGIKKGKLMVVEHENDLFNNY